MHLHKFVKMKEKKKKKLFKNFQIVYGVCKGYVFKWFDVVIVL